MLGNKSGFTFIELIIVIAILGIIAVIVTPVFRTPGYQREQFVTQVNALMQVAWQNAIVNNKNQKVIFDIEKNTISIEQATDKKTAKDEIVYEPIKSQHFVSTYEWPEEFEIRNFYLGKEDQMQIGVTEVGKKRVWLFVIPNGMAQPIVINIVNNKDDSQFGLVLNPFSVQFTQYDSFQRP